MASCGRSSRSRSGRGWSHLWIGSLPFMRESCQSSPCAVRAIPYRWPAMPTRSGPESIFCGVLGISILSGRDFEINDRFREPIPVIVTQSLARQLFGERDPVGAPLLAGRTNERRLEIIVVAADARMRTLGEQHAAAFFTPWVDAQLVVRVAGDPMQWIRPLRDALSGADMVSALDIRPMSDAAAGAIFPMRIAAVFAGSLSGLGLLLVVAGLFSSVSYATRRRTREMAIRAAIGGNWATILGAAVKDGVMVLACGVVIGLPLAVGAVRYLIDNLTAGVNPWRPPMFSGVAILLLSTGAVAAFYPGRLRGRPRRSRAGTPGRMT